MQDVRRFPLHGAPVRAGPGGILQGREQATPAAAAVDGGRGDELSPGDRAPARRLHNGLLGQRPRPAPRPRLPGLHVRLPRGPVPAGLPRPRPDGDIAGDLQGRAVLPVLRDGRHHGWPLPAISLRAGRVRAGRRPCGPVGHAAPVPALVSDTHRERHQWPVPVLTSGEGAGPGSLHGPEDLRDH